MRFWYETMKFWIDSKPKNCPTCRKEIRHKRNDNKKLSDLLKNGEDSLPKGIIDGLLFDVKRTAKEFFIDFLYHSNFKIPFSLLDSLETFFTYTVSVLFI